MALLNGIGKGDVQYVLEEVLSLLAFASTKVHMLTPAGEGDAQICAGRGAQFTCFTGTKVHILTGSMC